MTSLSKSFEKLDLITGQHRRRRRGHGEQPGSDGNEQKKRRRKRSSQPQPPPTQKPPEVTIAKLGRFKFSLEVGKGDSHKQPLTASSRPPQPPGSSHHIRQRKKSSPATLNEAAAATAPEVVKIPPPAAATSETSKQPLRSQRYGRSVSMDGPHPVIVEAAAAGAGQQPVPPPAMRPPVLLSKKPLPDRPLWVGERPTARKSSETEKLLKSPTSPTAPGGGNIDLIIGEEK